MKCFPKNITKSGLHAFSVIVGIILSNALLGACETESMQPTHIVQLRLPEWSGKYSVGRCVQEWTDSSRNDPFRPENPHRRLAAWVYFPAGERAKSSLADTLTNVSELVLEQSWSDAHKPLMQRRFGANAAESLRRLRTNALSNKANSLLSGRLPVLVFAHGMSCLPTDYSAVLEHLSSAGFVVVAIVSPGIASVVRFSEGTFIGHQKMEEALYDVLAADIHSAIKLVYRMNTDSGSIWRERLQTDRIGVFGHSIGGASAFAALAADSTIACAINVDGDLVGNGVAHKPQKPLLYFTTQPPSMQGVPVVEWDNDRSESRRSKVWSAFLGNSSFAVRVRVEGMFHHNMLDVALLPQEIFTANQRANRLGSIDGKRGIQLLSESIEAFFAHYLLQKERVYHPFDARFL